MRMMMKVSIPVESGNRGIVEGTLPKTIMGFVEQYKPEGAFFTAQGGERTAFFFFDMKDNATIPVICEPFFAQLNARIELTPAMNVEDMKSGVERATKKAY